MKPDKELVSYFLDMQRLSVFEQSAVFIFEPIRLNL